MRLSGVLATGPCRPRLEHRSCVESAAAAFTILAVAVPTGGFDESFVYQRRRQARHAGLHGRLHPRRSSFSDFKLSVKP